MEHLEARIMKNNTIICIFIFCNIAIINTPALFSQEAGGAQTLESLLALYKQTNDYHIIQSDSTISSNSQALFKKQVLPNVSLSASFPNINNSISPVIQPDGSEVFYNRFNASSSISISASQLIPFTGGVLVVSSSVVRLDNYIPTKNTSYNLNLINISYNQSLTGYNSYKWEKKQHELEEKRSKIQLIQSKEDVRARIVSLFFDLYLAQEEYRICRESEELSMYLSNKAEALYSQGIISYEDYLDILIEYKMTKIKTSSDIVDKAREQLSSFLNISEPTLRVSFNTESFFNKRCIVKEEELVERSLRFSIQGEKEMNELNSNLQLKKIKGERGPSISLSIGGGANSQSEEIRRLLGAYNSRVNLSLSLSMPLLDWGKNRIQRKSIEESIRIQQLQYNTTIKQIEKACHYDLIIMNTLISEYDAEIELIELIHRKIEKMKDNVLHGKIDIVDVSTLKTKLIQSEIHNIERLRQIYSIIYKYRKQALMDIWTGEILS